MSLFPSLRILILSFLLINVQSYKLINNNIRKTSFLNFVSDIKNSAIKSYESQSPFLDIKKFLSIFILTTFSIIPFNSVHAATDVIAARDILANQGGSAENQQQKTITLPSGIKYYDEVTGDGAEASEGKSVQFQWVLRRSNGYFVDSSANYGSEPFVYKVGNLNKAIKGVDEGIRGMKVGGIRRLAIPPSLAWTKEGVEAGSPGPIPLDFGPKRQILTRLDREVWYFEIKLTKVK